MSSIVAQLQAAFLNDNDRSFSNQRAPNVANNKKNAQSKNSRGGSRLKSAKLPNYMNESSFREPNSNNSAYGNMVSRFVKPSKVQLCLTHPFFLP